MRCRDLEKRKKTEPVRHSSGNDKDFTIFDAVLESLIKKETQKGWFHRFLNQLRSPRNIITLSLIISGMSILIWTGEIVWTDISIYKKSLLTILFGARTGENISLGLDIKLIYYVTLGAFLLFLSVIIRLKLVNSK
jgi:hypothetical protein